VRVAAAWPTAIGALLPALAIGLGLLVPRTPATGVLLLAAFVVSGALIGRWWAPLPSAAVVAALSLAELAGVGRSGTAVELHAGGFDMGFFLMSSAFAGALAGAGAAARVGFSFALRRLGPLRGWRDRLRGADQ
jgi:hypothetical protein